MQPEALDPLLHVPKEAGRDIGGEQADLTYQLAVMVPNPGMWPPPGR
jgi:hypothetical protein